MPGPLSLLGVNQSVVAEERTAEVIVHAHLNRLSVNPKIKARMG